MEQIVGVSVSQQLHDEIVLIRRVYKEWKPDKCADVPALLMRCAGREGLAFLWVPGSIKSILMFLWRASSSVERSKLVRRTARRSSTSSKTLAFLGVGFMSAPLTIVKELRSRSATCSKSKCP